MPFFASGRVVSVANEDLLNMHLTKESAIASQYARYDPLMVISTLRYHRLPLSSRPFTC